MKRLFYGNIFYILCVLYFIAAGIFIYVLGKEESFLIFNRHYVPALGQFYRYYTHVGDGFLIIALVLIFLFVRYYEALLLLVCYAVPSILVQVLKRLVFPDVSRPAKFYRWEKPLPLNFTEGVDSSLMNSFPSGHTASAFALFCVLSVVVKNTLWRTVFFVMAVNCALSRVYICEHFFVDTYAGAIISFVCCIVIIYAFENSSLKLKLQGSLLSKKP